MYLHLTEELPTPVPAPVVYYRNAGGAELGRAGRHAYWLRRAVNAGQSVEFFPVRVRAFQHKAGMLPPTQAHAGVFDDEQARKTVINLRDQFNSFQATATQRIEG